MNRRAEFRHDGKGNIQLVMREWDGIDRADYTKIQIWTGAQFGRYLAHLETQFADLIRDSIVAEKAAAAMLAAEEAERCAGYGI